MIQRNSTDALLRDLNINQFRSINLHRAEFSFLLKKNFWIRGVKQVWFSTHPTVTCAFYNLSGSGSKLSSVTVNVCADSIDSARSYGTQLHFRKHLLCFLHDLLTHPIFSLSVNVKNRNILFYHDGWHQWWSPRGAYLAIALTAAGEIWQVRNETLTVLNTTFHNIAVKLTFLGENISGVTSESSIQKKKQCVFILLHLSHVRNLSCCLLPTLIPFLINYF